VIIALDTTVLRRIFAGLEHVPVAQQSAASPLREYSRLMRLARHQFVVPMLVYAEFLAGFSLAEQERYAPIIADARFRFTPFDRAAAVRAASIPAEFYSVSDRCPA